MNGDKMVAIINDLYKMQLQRWNRRRDDEWRVTILVWTGAAAATWFLAGRVQLSYWALVPYSVVWFLYVCLWLYPVWQANERDKAWAEVYRSWVDKAVGLRQSTETFEKPIWYNFFKDWSMRFQGISALLVLLLSWYILYEIPVGSSGA